MRERRRVDERRGLRLRHAKREPFDASVSECERVFYDAENPLAWLQAAEVVNLEEVA